MTVVHPAYDPIDKVWYTDDGLLAPSLKQLSKLLPHNSRIVGYYPHGYHHKIDYKKPMHAQEDFSPRPKLLNASRVIMPQRKRMVSKRTPKGKRYDHDAVLNLWAKGLSAPEIACQLGYQRWLAVGSIVSEARKRGDRRAVSRAPSTWKYRGRNIKRI